MRGFWLLVHVLGFTLWLGAGIATMIAGLTAKRFAPAERLAAYRVMSAVFRMVVAPGWSACSWAASCSARPTCAATCRDGWA